MIDFYPHLTHTGTMNEDNYKTSNGDDYDVELAIPVMVQVEDIPEDDSEKTIANLLK